MRAGLHNSASSSSSVVSDQNIFSPPNFSKKTSPRRGSRSRLLRSFIYTFQILLASYFRLLLLLLLLSYTPGYWPTRGRGENGKFEDLLVRKPGRRLNGPGSADRNRETPHYFHFEIAYEASRRFPASESARTLSIRRGLIYDALSSDQARFNFGFRSSALFPPSPSIGSVIDRVFLERSQPLGPDVDPTT